MADFSKLEPEGFRTELENLDAEKLDVTKAHWVDVVDFGAVGDGTTNNDQAFMDADVATGENDVVFVGPGTYNLVSYIPQSKLFGPGKVILSNDAGEVQLDTTMPVHMDMDRQAALNMIVGPDSGLNRAPNGGYASTAFGHGTMKVTPSPSRSTAFGKMTMSVALSPYSSDAFGSDALGWGEYMNRCTAIGGNSLKWAGTSDPVEAAHDFYVDKGWTDGDFLVHVGVTAQWPNVRNDFAGHNGSPNPNRLAGANADNIGNIGLGRNALLHLTRGEENVAIGRNSMAQALHCDKNVAVGRNTLYMNISGFANVAMGEGAGRQNASAGENVYLGKWAGNENSHSWGNVFIGAEAGRIFDDGASAPLSVTTGARRNIGIGYWALRNASQSVWNIAIGDEALRTTSGNFNLGIGKNSLLPASGDYNVGAGFGSGQNLSSGSYNTFLGSRAGQNLQSGASATNLTNATCIGGQSSVSGSNQVQLGDSATTTYAYGAVQNRSDKRDKADIRDTGLGMEFLREHRAVEHRWDYREDYWYYDESGNIVEEERDGSKKRSRFHQGFIAQEVKEICDRLGVDFAGLQHHEHNGGLDVWSLGYQEYIPVIVNALQQLDARLTQLET